MFLESIDHERGKKNKTKKTRENSKIKGTVKG